MKPNLVIYRAVVFPVFVFLLYAASARTTDTQWRPKSNISEKLGWCGRQNMLRPYLKIWNWIFGRAVKAISSMGIRSPCASAFLDAFNIFCCGSFCRHPLDGSTGILFRKFFLPIVRNNCSKGQLISKWCHRLDQITNGKFDTKGHFDISWSKICQF